MQCIVEPYNAVYFCNLKTRPDHCLYNWSHLQYHSLYHFFYFNTSLCIPGSLYHCENPLRPHWSAPLVFTTSLCISLVYMYHLSAYHQSSHHLSIPLALTLVFPLVDTTTHQRVLVHYLSFFSSPAPASIDPPCIPPFAPTTPPVPSPGKLERLP